MRWSLDRGFTELIETRQQERVEILIKGLTEYYDKSGSWEPLAGIKRQWIQLLLKSNLSV